MRWRTLKHWYLYNQDPWYNFPKFLQSFEYLNEFLMLSCVMMMVVKITWNVNRILRCSSLLLILLYRLKDQFMSCKSWCNHFDIKSIHLSNFLPITYGWFNFWNQNWKRFLSKTYWLLSCFYAFIWKKWDFVLGPHSVDKVTDLNNNYYMGHDYRASFVVVLVHLDVLSLRPQTNTTSASALAAARLATRR